MATPETTVEARHEDATPIVRYKPVPSAVPAASGIVV
jgi:hypothetical protein